MTGSLKAKFYCIDNFLTRYSQISMVNLTLNDEYTLYDTDGK